MAINTIKNFDVDEIENKNNHYDIVIKKLSGMTLEQIGQEYGLTRERIRQIEAKALRKLRHPSRAKKLRDFLIE